MKQPAHLQPLLHWQWYIVAALAVMWLALLRASGEMISILQKVQRKQSLFWDCSWCMHMHLDVSRACIDVPNIH
jgi:hypothetical protein